MHCKNKGKRKCLCMLSFYAPSWLSTSPAYKWFGEQTKAYVDSFSFSDVGSNYFQIFVDAVSTKVMSKVCQIWSVSKRCFKLLTLSGCMYWGIIAPQWLRLWATDQMVVTLSPGTDKIYLLIFSFFDDFLYTCTYCYLILLYYIPLSQFTFNLKLLIENINIPAIFGEPWFPFFSRITQIAQSSDKTPSLDIFFN